MYYTLDELEVIELIETSNSADYYLDLEDLELPDILQVQAL